MQAVNSERMLGSLVSLLPKKIYLFLTGKPVVRLIFISSSHIGFCPVPTNTAKISQVSTKIYRTYINHSAPVSQQCLIAVFYIAQDIKLACLIFR